MHVHHLLVILVALDGQPRDTVPLYTDLGDHHVPITTPVSLAQRYFDQGMRLLYGFNHGEAIRSFNHAAQLDSNCAMCYRSEEHTSELQSQSNLVCRLLLEKKKNN